MPHLFHTGFTRVAGGLGKGDAFVKLLFAPQVQAALYIIQMAVCGLHREGGILVQYRLKNRFVLFGKLGIDARYAEQVGKVAFGMAGQQAQQAV